MTEQQDRIARAMAPLERAAIAEPAKGLSSNIVMIDRGALVDVINLCREAWFVALAREQVKP